MEAIRLPRFTRVDDINSIILTERDREIIRHVHRHRFLRSSHILALTAGSPQQVLRRLQLLYHHGYLERPRAQIDYFHQHGSRPIAYGLGNKGIALLRDEEALPKSSLDWSFKNRSARRLFLEHTLMIADVMVTLELACRRQGDVHLLTDDCLPLPAGTRTKAEPFRWQVQVSSRLKVGLIPDRVFGLEFPDGQRAFYFLEADRGTMPINRDGLAQTSFFRKLLSYEATWTQNIHRSRFGFHRFRVLTVTTSQERVANLVEACTRIERGRGLFLFSDLQSFLACPDILRMPWATATADTDAVLIKR